MKPDWDKLMTAFSGSSVFVADVDCTTDEGKPICERLEVEGFPTIMHFNKDAEKGAQYEGGRDYSSLKKFVKKTLKGIERKCDVVSKDACTPEQVEGLKQFEGLSADALAAEFKKR